MISRKKPVAHTTCPNKRKGSNRKNLIPLKTFSRFRTRHPIQNRTKTEDKKMAGGRRFIEELSLGDTV